MSEIEHPEDIKLNARLNDLKTPINSESSNIPKLEEEISSNIPKKEDLEFFEKALNNKAEKLSESPPIVDPNYEVSTPWEVDFSKASVEPIATSNKCERFDGISDKPDLNSLNTGGLGDHLAKDSTVSDLYELVVNSAAEILSNPGINLSPRQFGFYLSVALGAYIVAKCKDSEPQSSKSSNKSDSNSSCYPNAKYGLANGPSQKYIDDVRDVTVNMNPANLINNGNLFDADSFRNNIGNGNGYLVTARDLLGHPHIIGTDGIQYVNGGLNRYNMAIMAVNQPAFYPVEARNRVNGEGYGLYGGSSERHPGFMYLGKGDDALAKRVLSNVEAGLEPVSDLPMLLAHSRQWIDLRTQYSLFNHMFNNINAPEWNDPCIRHIPICPDIQGNVRPHDTGIMLHLVDDISDYRNMNQQTFNLAKSHCGDLLIDLAIILIDEIDTLDDRDEINDGESRYNQERSIHKRAHEFLAVLHHYQIHFKNRSGPSG